MAWFPAEGGGNVTLSQAERDSGYWTQCTISNAEVGKRYCLTYTGEQSTSHSVSGGTEEDYLTTYSGNWGSYSLYTSCIVFTATSSTVTINVTGNTYPYANGILIKIS